MSGSASRLPGTAQRPVATYSIVARDAVTGELGVAVQSHWFSVGALVPWVEAGVGAVATQSFVDPSYGPLGLEMMRAGRAAPDALAGLLAADDGRELRQVAMVDAAGRCGAHTGRRCVASAGHVIDTDLGVTCQANLMLTDTVWEAMLDAYRSALANGDDLADRMLAALDAAEAEGGDIRGKQSAALVVVSGTPTGRSWEDRLFDLRVEDHTDPLGELRRLVTLRRAYRHMNRGDAALEAEDHEAALEHHGAARRLAPHIVEMPFWTAVGLASVGRHDEAMPLFRDVFAREPAWRTLLPRLVDSDLIPEAAARRVIDDTSDV